MLSKFGHNFKFKKKKKNNDSVPVENRASVAIKTDRISEDNGRFTN
jgi:hypothetical protein